MAEVVLDAVKKIYAGDVTAVRGMDLHVRNAEFIVLVGPSGCGKSTTLRMIAGLEEISSGTVRIGDRVVNRVPPKDRDVAMVFQNYALYPHMTAYKNMAFGLKLRKFKRDEIDRRVKQVAAALGTDELLARKPKALSGGQRQRVALGRAIVYNPSCFLFDEPLSNLDAKLRVETRAEIKRLHKRLATTTIYVTHDQEEAMTLGDRVVVMSDGLIQQCDTPLNIYNAPINRFVAGFLGAPPMNFFDGTIGANGGKTYFRGAGLELELEPEKAQLVADRVGQNVVMGIRPEGMFIRRCDLANNQAHSFAARIDVREPLGNDMDLYGLTQTENRFVARITAEPVEEGKDVRVYLNMEKTHIFEPGEYGQNLTLRATERIEEPPTIA